MAKQNIDIRKMRDDEEDAAALALTRAFDENPLFVFLLPEPGRRAKWLMWFHRVALGEARRVGEVWVANDATEGAIVIFPPHAFPASIGISLRATPFIPGIPTPRLLRCGLGAELRTRRMHPSFDHVYIRVLGVDPTVKGRGLGGALLGHTLSMARSLGVRTYLETANPDNLSFYARFGFEVLGDIGDYGGPTIWRLATVS